MSASSTIKYGTATVILIVAVYIGLKRNSIEDELHQTVLESLRRAENKVHPQPAKVNFDEIHQQILVKPVVIEL